MEQASGTGVYTHDFKCFYMITHHLSEQLNRERGFVSLKCGQQPDLMLVVVHFGHKSVLKTISMYASIVLSAFIHLFLFFLPQYFAPENPIS